MNVPMPPREMDVLRLASEGLPDKAIAHQLGLSESTVGNYLVRTFRRLGVQSRIEAFRKMGWLA